MLNIDEALKTVLENISTLETEEKESYNCAGQVLAEDTFSDLNLPMKDSATQDGYAVRSADTVNASKNQPVNLRINETIRAGSLPEYIVEAGTAARIMTGSILPEGADCVIRFEDTDEPPNKNGPNSNNPSHVKVFSPGRPGTNIRKQGSNISRGTLVLPKGTIIGPNHISVLMSIGKASIKVIRRPVIAVIATGDELVSPGRPLTPEKSYNSNTAAVGSMITYYGGTPLILGIARDYETSILAKMRRAQSADAIITTGGVSRGDFDLVRLMLQKVGQVKFARIRMGPGASFAFGIITKLPGTQSLPVFALSGPPTGCLINFEMLVKPALFKMKGIAPVKDACIEAIAEDSLDGKRPMAFVKWTELKKENGEYRVCLNTSESIGTMIPIARANSLAIIPEGAEIKKGDRVKVYPLDWCKKNELE